MKKKGKKPWEMLLLELLRPFAQELPFSSSHPEALADKPAVSPAVFLTRSYWQLPQQSPSLSTMTFRFPLQPCIFLFDFASIRIHLLTCMYPISTLRLGRLRAEGGGRMALSVR